MYSKVNIGRVFLCHSSQDKAIVQKIATILRKADILVWYDDWEIGWGDSIVEKINSGLESCSNLIIFLSSASVSSDWVKRELNSSLISQLSSKNIKILPIKIEECNIPYLLRDIKWISLSNQESYPSGLKNIFKALLPESDAEAAITKLGEFLPELISEDAERIKYVSCPNCGGRALRTYTEKKDGDYEYKYHSGIQCEQCGMLFIGSNINTCPDCNIPMIWSKIGSSEGAYGSYEDDFAWECPNCRNENHYKDSEKSK